MASECEARVRPVSAVALTVVALLALAAPVDAQPPGRRPAAPVTVENVETQPIPVRGQVDVANFPAVQSVFVTNLPAAVGAKQRVQIFDVTLISPGDDGFSAFGFGKSIYTVPAGKRLIVETVSAFGSDIQGVHFDVSLHGSGANLAFLLTTKGVFAAGSIPQKGRDAVTTTATLIVNPGDPLTYQFIRDVSTSTESAGTSITVVGFLEDAP